MKKNYIYSILALFIIAQPVFSQELGSVKIGVVDVNKLCLLYTSPSPRDATLSGVAWCG